MALILWAFTERPVWWTGWHWGGLGIAVVIAAVTGAAGWMFLTVQEVSAPIARPSYSHEWRFNHGDATSPPALGLAMSGGGIRSAAFNVGVLQALHESGILRTVEVMSAVSGGSYAMSWYLLQPYYAALAATRNGTSFDLDALMNEMFDPSGRFQTHLCHDPCIVEKLDLAIGAVLGATWFQPLRALSGSMGDLARYNAGGSVREDYRDGIQRIFQGHPHRDQPGTIQNAISTAERQQMNLESGIFCSVAPVRYPQLSSFVLEHHLPFFIFNGAVLVDRPHRHMLWPCAFEFTADDLGSDVCGYRRWDELKDMDISDERAQRTFGGWLDGIRYLRQHEEERRPNRWLFLVNLAPAISGAAVGLSYFNPRKSLSQSRLTTWAPFAGNLDLGYLLPRAIWNRTGALYVSDGGHCENLGAYALVKRRCRTMIVVDAEHEASVPYVFDSYAKLKAQLRDEMRLELEVPEIDAYLQGAQRADQQTGPPLALMVGTVRPAAVAPTTPPMSVIYIKLTLDREQMESYPAAVRDHAREDATFPQDPTSNQAFTAARFVAYRELGHHVATGVAQALAAL